MATSRTKRTLAAVSRETQEEHPRNGQSRNTSVPSFDEKYNALIFEKIGGRLTKKLSQEISRTGSHILSTLSKTDTDTLWNRSGNSRDIDVENQEPTGDRFQVGPHPAVKFMSIVPATRLSQIQKRPPTACSFNKSVRIIARYFLRSSFHVASMATFLLLGQKPVQIPAFAYFVFLPFLISRSKHSQ